MSKLGSNQLLNGTGSLLACYTTEPDKTVKPILSPANSSKLKLTLPKESMDTLHQKELLLGNLLLGYMYLLNTLEHNIQGVTDNLCGKHSVQASQAKHFVPAVALHFSTSNISGK